jgi:hypothetical protein
MVELTQVLEDQLDKANDVVEEYSGQKYDDLKEVVQESGMVGGKKRKQTRGKKAKKGKKSKKVKKVKKSKKSKKSKKVKKPKRAKTAKRSGKKNYLSFCAMYAKKHGFPNARAVMKNPQCKAAFHAQ